MGRTIQREHITRNSIRCKGCGEDIESTHRHDFRPCSCGAVAVDGGKDYRRRCWQGDGPGYEETSVFTVEEVEVEW